MQPTLDTWTSVFLLAVAMGLYLFIMLISSRNNKNFPIAFLILSFSVILFQYVLYWTRYETVFPYLMMLPPLCYYTTGPLLYLYFLNLYRKKVRFNYLLHFFISILTLVSNLVLWLKYMGLENMKVPFMFLIRGHWLITIHMCLYTFLIIRLIRDQQTLDTEFNKVRYKWSKVLVSLYSIFILAYISYYVLVNFSFFNSQWDYMISVMMSISIYAIGYFIIKQPSIFDGEMYANLFLPIKNKNETFEASMLNEFFENITNYMESKKPYRDNELRLVNLADQLGFSTHLLSKIINKKSGKNFNHFINDYRLREAEALISENSSTRIKSIYFDVGFNNKATFYKAFKSKHNCTPLEYKNTSEAN